MILSDSVFFIEIVNFLCHDVLDAQLFKRPFSEWSNWLVFFFLEFWYLNIKVRWKIPVIHLIFSETLNVLSRYLLYTYIPTTLSQWKKQLSDSAKLKFEMAIDSKHNFTYFVHSNTAYIEKKLQRFDCSLLHFGDFKLKLLQI